MIKIKNRNQYDIIYECLIHCQKNETSETFANTRSRFNTVVGGNSRVSKSFADILLNAELIEVNPEVEYYKEVYKVSKKGEEYIEHYQKLKGLLTWGEKYE